MPKSMIPIESPKGSSTCRSIFSSRYSSSAIRSTSYALRRQARRSGAPSCARTANGSGSTRSSTIGPPYHPVTTAVCASLNTSIYYLLRIASYVGFANIELRSYLLTPIQECGSDKGKYSLWAFFERLCNKCIKTKCVRHACLSPTFVSDLLTIRRYMVIDRNAAYYGVRIWYRLPGSKGAPATAPMT